MTEAARPPQGIVALRRARRRGANRPYVGPAHHELIRSLAVRGAIRILLAIVGVVAVMLAIIYFMVPAGSLPFPDALGHEAGSQVIHVKHGIAALVAGLVCWVLVWDMGPPLR